MCMTRLENNLAVWLILTKNKILITVKNIDIFSNFFAGAVGVRDSGYPLYLFLKKFQDSFFTENLLIKPLKFEP